MYRSQDYQPPKFSSRSLLSTFVFTGALSLSRWESLSSLGSGSSSGVSRPEHRQLGLSHDSGITTNGSGKNGTAVTILHCI